MPNSLFHLSLGIAAAWTGLSGAQAHGVEQPFLSLGAEVDAPRGFVEMCQSDATFCQSDADRSPGDVRLVTGALVSQRSEVATPRRTDISLPVAVVPSAISLAPVRDGVGTRLNLAAAWMGLSHAQAPRFEQPLLSLVAEVIAPLGSVEMCQSDATSCKADAEKSSGDARLVTGALVSQRSDATMPWRTDMLVPAAVAAPAISLAPLCDGVGIRLNLFAAKQFGAVFREPLSPARSLTTPDARWGARSPVELFVPAAPTLPSPAPAGAPAADMRAPVSPASSVALLQRVNRFVNARVLQRTDEQVYGRAEYWHRSGVGHGAAGDCEDIAIEKRLELIQAGFPAASLYFAVVYEREVGLHAVLIARTPTGDFVLDSRTPYINRWDKTSYSFVTIQSAREPMRWYAPDRLPVETAVAAATANLS